MKMKNYAYVMDEPCKHCGKKHYYLTNNHIIITGSKEELEELNIAGCKVELLDRTKTDIKETDYVFNIWKELDTSKEGILKNVGGRLPAFTFGYSLADISISDNKKFINIKYKHLTDEKNNLGE